MGLFDFSLIRKSVKSLEERLKALRIEMNDLQRQRGQIMAAPLCKADIKVFMSDWVSRSGKAYTESFQSGIGRLSRSPGGVMQSFSSTGPSAVRLLGATTPFGETPGPADMDRALCAFMGSQVIAFMEKAIDTMEWPAEGLPMANRPAAVSRIDERIGELMKEEKDLLEQAQEAGLSLS